MILDNKEKLLFSRGTSEDRKRILKDKLEFQVTILKSAPDITTLMKAQGAVSVLEVLLGSFS